jgi:hypothetical protein
MNRLLFIGALLLSTTAHARDKAQDIADVQHVMDTFHQAVVSHDGAALAALFIPAGSTWLNVLASDGKIRVGSYQDFANFVSGSKDNLDPRHSHVRIQSDGVIASAYFDFVFLINGKAENRGSETWQLVKGADGWRIAALTYSSNP